MGFRKIESLRLVLIIVVFFTCSTVAQYGNVELRPIKAVCVMNAGPPGSLVKGTITLQQTDCPQSSISITGSISGLTAGLHGFHVHQFGDLTNTSNPCLSTGPHYNPTNKVHGGQQDDVRHVGDLGNISAGADGVAPVDKTDDLIKLCGDQSVLGRALVVHAQMDDLGKGEGESKTNGNSGTRVGCCVIGLANS